jgi:hypothetical protein
VADRTCDGLTCATGLGGILRRAGAGGCPNAQQVWLSVWSYILVPLRGTLCGLPPALSLTAAAALRVSDVVGLNVAVIVH